MLGTMPSSSSAASPRNHLSTARHRSNNSCSGAINVPGLEDLSLQPRRGQALQDLDNVAFPELKAQSSRGKMATQQTGTTKAGMGFDQLAKSTADNAKQARPQASLRDRNKAQRSSPQRRRSVTRGNGIKAKGISRSTHASTLRSSSPSSMPQSKFAGAKRLPLKLPSPPLALISDPYQDLGEHLRRHGLVADADNFASAPGITPDFVLHAWMTGIAYDGATGLLNATNTFMNTHGDHIHAQLGEAQEKDLPIPFSFSLSSDSLAAGANNVASGMVPTHILAVHSRDAKDKGFLVPCHGLLYALQCVSLPSLANRAQGKSERQKPGDQAAAEMPVVSITVPRPSEFVVTHRFLYLRDASTLMMDLLPMTLISQYAEENRQKLARHDAELMPPPMHASLAASSFRSTSNLNDISSIFAGAPALSPSELSTLMDMPLHTPTSAPLSSFPTSSSTSSSDAAGATPAQQQSAPRARTASCPSATTTRPATTISDPAPRAKTLATCAVEALATLPVNTLLTYVYRIHSAWANGVAIGVLSPTYWTTLDRAWTIVVAALGVKKGRLVDAEMRGMKLGLAG